MMVIAFVSVYFLDVSAMIIIFVCIGIGLLDLLYQSGKTKKEGAEK